MLFVVLLFMNLVMASDRLRIKSMFTGDEYQDNETELFEFDGDNIIGISKVVQQICSGNIKRTPMMIFGIDDIEKIPELSNLYNRLTEIYEYEEEIEESFEKYITSNYYNDELLKDSSIPVLYNFFLEALEEFYGTTPYYTGDMMLQIAEELDLADMIPYIRQNPKSIFSTSNDHIISPEYIKYYNVCMDIKVDQELMKLF